MVGAVLGGGFILCLFEDAPASLMAVFETAHRGGSRALATAFLDRAILPGARRNAGASVTMAENIALPARE